MGMGHSSVIQPFSPLQIVERRMKKKSTVVAAAANIIGLGERQKTMVEQKRKVC